MIAIKLFKEQNLKGYTLIEGFPGIGLVGPMAASYMIEKLGMDYIGYVASDFFPPIAAVHEGTPMHTARISKDAKNKLGIIFSEFTIPTNAVYQLGDETISFIRKYGLQRVISIGGMPSSKQDEVPYVITSDPALLKKASAQGIKQIKEGVIAGVSAVLLTSAVELGIPTMNLLVQVNPEIMNPKYAETAIQGLHKLIGLEIDLSELQKETKEVEAKVRELLKKAKDSKERYQKQAGETDSSGPSMYA
ncbi:PAC2 family protein [uncultured archaeon]|nr:PAC2 family protein [uncultured archaeon]